MRTARRLKVASEVAALPSKRQLRETLEVLRLDRHRSFQALDDAVRNEPASLVKAVVASMLDIQKLSREIGLMEGLLMKPGCYRPVLRRRSRA